MVHDVDAGDDAAGDLDTARRSSCSDEYCNTFIPT